MLDVQARSGVKAFNGLQQVTITDASFAQETVQELGYTDVKDFHNEFKKISKIIEKAENRMDVDDVSTFPEMFSYMTPYVIGPHGASLA